MKLTSILTLNIILVSSDGQMVSYGMRRLALSMNQFGLDMMRVIDSTNRDSVVNQTIMNSYSFCPFCIGSSLAMLMAGLIYPTSFTGTTRSAYESLRYALYLNSMQPQEINLAFLDLMRHLQVNLPQGFRAKRSSQQEPIESKVKESSFGTHNSARIINQIYIQRYLPVDYNYYVLTQYYFKTPIRSLDFAYAAEESRQHINAMVEYASDNKIDQLLKPLQDERIWYNTRLLFLSALCFEGQLDFRQARARASYFRVWPQRRPVNVQYNLPMVHVALTTTPSPATHTSNTTALLNQTSNRKPSPHSVTVSASNHSQTVTNKVEFNPFKPLHSQQMRTKESIRLRYSHNTYLNSTLVEMPFVGGILSMVVIVPDTVSSFNLLLSRLNAQLILDLIQTLEVKRIDITVSGFTEQNLSIQTV